MTRIVSAGVAVIAAAYLGVLFFPWTEGDDSQFGVGEVSGLDVSPAAFSFLTGLGLFLWEVMAALGVRRTLRSDSLVTFFLAAATGVMGIATVAHLKWGNPLPWTRDLDTAAFAALPLSILLLAGAIAHLGFYVLTSRAAR